MRKIDIYYNVSTDKKKRNLKYYCSSLVLNKITCKQHKNKIVSSCKFLENKEVYCFFDHDYNK